jgi:hypothetical protein
MPCAVFWTACRFAWKQGQGETKFANFFAGFCKNKKSRPTRPAQTDCNISSQETIKRRKSAGVSSEGEKSAKDVLIFHAFSLPGRPASGRAETVECTLRMRDQISTARLWRPAECALAGTLRWPVRLNCSAYKPTFFPSPLFFITSFFDVYQGARQAVNIMESEAGITAAIHYHYGTTPDQRAAFQYLFRPQRLVNN